MNDITKRPFKREDIKEIECRFAVYIPPAVERNGRRSRDDFHLVKENIHLKNGETVPHVHFIKNLEYNYWKTREAFASKHKSKKEWEYISRLQKFSTTRGRYLEDASRMFQDRNVFRNASIGKDKLWHKEESYLKRQLARSPYLYGSDIESTALIKHTYKEKFQGEGTEFSVACFDTEADMIRGHGRINIATLSFKERVVTAVTKEFVEGIPDVKNKLYALFEKLLGDVKKDRNIQWELLIVNNDMQVVEACFKRAHEWKPDIVGIWNIDYDMTKMIETMAKFSVEPKDVFTDPAVPKESRYFEYKRGQSQKVTEGGKVTPIKPPARWHTVFTPSSFYFLDAMCVYRHLRTGQGEEPSYGLDAIMKKHIKRGKLDFEEVAESDGPDWHIEMQSRYPLEYIIYNVFDTVGMEMLDEETTDMSVSLPLQAGPSDWKNFNSQPRRVCDELHSHVLKEGRVMGTTSDQMTDEFDKLTIGLSDWITMLPPHPVMDNGLKLIIEFPDVTTNIRLHTGD